MLVYEKKVSEEDISVKKTKLFGNYSGSIPTESDEELTYKLGGTETEITSETIKENNMRFLDDTRGGIIARSSVDSETINEILTVFIGEDQIIPKPAKSEPELESIEVTTLPTKTEYIDPTVGTTIDTAGMVVTGTYNDGSTKEITDYEVTPGELPSGSGDWEITVSFEGKTTTFNVTATYQE